MLAEVGFFKFDLAVGHGTLDFVRAYNVGAAALNDVLDYSKVRERHHSPFSILHIMPTPLALDFLRMSHIKWYLP